MNRYKCIATRAGMVPGYWRVSIVDASEKEIDRVETFQTKRNATKLAYEIEERGTWTTGLSGARFERRLFDGSRVE